MQYKALDKYSDTLTRTRQDRVSFFMAQQSKTKQKSIGTTFNTLKLSQDQSSTKNL